ncbi:MAG: hypothetical protein HKN47_02180 [Pirellulaceae bacterium]|nr:hypothetical protein [Pirellulaceae bacterium]
MKTLATRKQSEAIRDQMRSVRSELPYAMDDARDELKQLADWKYYVRKLPMTSILATAAAAYMAVPSSHTRRPVNRSEEESSVPEKSFLAGLTGSLVAMALRTGTSMAMRHASGMFLNSAGPKTTQRSLYN